MTYTIGIDPDSERHGYAVYENGRLIVCGTATTVEIITGHLPDLLERGAVRFGIEDVMANQFVYGRNVKASKAAQSKVAMHIGRCQQAQLELMRWLERYDITVILHRPQRGNWADNKAQFESVTGWAGRSNADSRSAAFFGWLTLHKFN
jgi:hypothetical protein